MTISTFSTALFFLSDNNFTVIRTNAEAFLADQEKFPRRQITARKVAGQKIAAGRTLVVRINFFNINKYITRAIIVALN